MKENLVRLTKFKSLSRNELSEINGGLQCSVTVNYYNDGKVVGQRSYSGSTSTLCGISSCTQWRKTMMQAINTNLENTNTMYPAGNDYTC